jgi:hypothetical protein
MKHNTQLYFSAKPYSGTSVGNSTIGSKGQHRRATIRQPRSNARAAAFCSVLPQLIAGEIRDRVIYGGTVARGFRFALNPGLHAREAIL